MPPLNAYIDLHCERLQDGLFEEPFNTLSNLVFFVVAYFLVKNHKNRPLLANVLIALVLCFAVGSIIFHSSARMWGALMDSVPIALYSIIYVVAFGRQIMRTNWLGVLALLGLFIGIYFGVKYLYLGSTHGKMPDGYVTMIPVVYYLFILTGLMYLFKNQSAPVFLKITFVALAAVFFRGLDMMLCDKFALGTHWLWHVLAGGMIYLQIQELIKRYHKVDFKA
jgi:hypothetical protein